MPPQEVQRERKESRRTSETSPGTWLDGAQKGSLWPCYAGSLSKKRKSEISGKRRRPKPIPWKKNSLEKLGGVEGQPGARDGGEGVEGEDTKWAIGG